MKEHGRHLFCGVKYHSWKYAISSAQQVHLQQTLLHRELLKNTLMPCQMSMGPLAAGVPFKKIVYWGPVLFNVANVKIQHWP